MHNSALLLPRGRADAIADNIGHYRVRELGFTLGLERSWARTGRASEGGSPIDLSLSRFRTCSGLQQGRIRCRAGVSGALMPGHRYMVKEVGPGAFTVWRVMAEGHAV